MSSGAAAVPHPGDPSGAADDAAADLPSLWADLVGAVRRIRRQLDLRLQEAVGLLASDHDLLVAVRDADGQATMSRLARTVGGSPSGVTRAVTRLTDAGLLDVDARRLTAAGPDRRLSYVRLTPAGVVRLAQARPVVAAELERLLGRHLDPAAATMIRELLDRLPDA